ncbi:non-ribosomal peptide synthetase [uncultured Shewanella sp.]|uniref:non-ribosomal peptide synthetase n=1 Tax=uncultured Shewanella sp. TaxID=173975 RepID=UPI002637406D|nr:non-ribosomal peptide synthetase [uncultured Shewanella sp.]
MPNTILISPSIAESFPIVGPQLGIWLADQLATKNNTFAVAQYIEFFGDIDVGVLNKAIKLGLMEADTVHSVYENMPDGVVQTIFPLPTFEQLDDISFIDLSMTSEAEEQAMSLMQHDIEQAPRADVVNHSYHHKIIQLPTKNGKDRWFWYQRYHHLMLDGFSFTALTQRITDIYSALIAKSEIGKSPFTSYKSVINEYIAYDTSAKKGKDQQFWQDYCSKIPPQASLSYQASTNVDGLNTQVIRHKFTLPVAVSKQIQQGACFSIADIASAAILIYLSKMTHQETICIGYPLMRRMGSQALTALGTAVNVLPLIVTVLPEYSFNNIVDILIKEVKKIRRHQKYEAEQIQRDIGLAGGQKRMYSATLNCKLFDYRLDLAGISGHTHQLATGPIEDIEFGVYVHQGALSIEFAANASRYTQKELQLHGQRLIHILSQYGLDIEKKVDRTIAALSIVTPAETNHLTQWSMGKKISLDQYGNSIVTLLSKHISRHDSHTAIVFGDQQISFNQLAKRVNQLSRLLLSNHVKHGDLVAVALPRSTESIISIFAIMSIGAVYLPLDLSHPAERLAMMCEDKVPCLILTTKAQQTLLPSNIEALRLDDKSTLELLTACYNSPLPADVSVVNKQDLAYVFYTSGSTGRPKGVMVSHGALINLVAALEDKVYSCIPSTQGSQKTHQSHNHKINNPLHVALTGSLSFDTSWDPILLMTLGHTLYLYEDDIKKDVFALLDLIDRDKIDTLAVAPSLATQLVQAGLCEADHQPQLMTICGEPVPPSLWQALQYSSISAHNIYGPTEFTVYATSQEISPQSPNVLIGRPFANTRVYVLDENLAPVPVGVNGELYLAGENMSAGYLNRPEITATRFVADPFTNGDVMYVTGDIVRWSMEGELIFVGRCDNQVKVRGFRIELGDVESALSFLEDTKEVAVIVEKTENGNRLLAYCTVVSDTSMYEQMAESIQEQLSQVLPHYMVPAAVTILPEMPLTVSGKINKKALPKPFIASQTSILPSTKKEIMICDEISTILALDSVGLEDDFFKMAGDSISAMRLSIMLRKKGFELKPQDIFTDRTPAKMAMSMTELLLPNNHLQQANEISTNAAITMPSDLHQAQLAMPAILPAFMPTPDEVNLLVERYGEQSIILPTLPLQSGLLFHAQVADEESQYSFTSRLTLKGEINLPQLQEAVAHILVKYPQLAAQFDIELTGKPLQLIPTMTLEQARCYCPISTKDFSAISDESKQQALLSFTMAEAYRNFGLGSDNNVKAANEGRLFFITLIKMYDEEYELVITAHHLIIDGWSTPILLRDLFNTYQDIESLSLNTNTYQDVVYQMANRATQEAKAQWKSALENVSPTILYSNTNQESFKVAELHESLGTELTAAVNQFCQQHGVTLNTLIQGVWGAHLGAMTGRNNVVFGSPVSGRFSDISGVDEQVGLFSNTLPVNINFNADDTFLAQLMKLQAQQITLMPYDCLGLGEIQRLIDVDNLFDTLLVVENYPVQETLLTQSFKGVSIEHVENKGYTHYPLTILVLPGNDIRVLFEYRGKVHEAERLAKRFIQIIKQVVSDPSITLAQLSMQTEADISLIKTANNTDIALPNNSLRGLLRKQAEKSPLSIALKDRHQTLTYQEVRNLVEKVSLGLLSCRANSPHNNRSDNKHDDTIPAGIVGVAIPRSCELSIALQSVIEIGAAYLPLDSSYPNERLAMMLSDANIDTLIITQEQFSRFSEKAFSQLPMNVISIEQLMQTTTINNSFITEHKLREVAPSDAAYVIYTSGSTGRPKGVVVSNQAIVNRLLWMQDEYCLSSSDVVLQKTPSSFDVSVWEFFWPLIQGACLYMAPPEVHRDPEALLNIIVSEHITTLHFVPSMLAAFLDNVKDSDYLPQINSSIKNVFCSGEALSIALTEQFQSLCLAPLHNLYGPTEAAVDVTYYEAKKAIGKDLQGVPIGAPVWNTQLRILDHQLRAVGVECVGELYLTGCQLASGYLNRPELTADRFVADPFAHGQRMYRTGDIAKWLPDGNLLYLGRTDDQLKIRGLRVEIGEIEQALLQLKPIKHAAVHARALSHSLRTNQLEDNRQLVGYYIKEIGQQDEEYQINHEQMLAELSLSLPAHMVPVALVEVSSFPLSANGKLDKKSLPDPKLETDPSNREPSAGAETIIAQTFKRLLNVEHVSAQDSFFNLGGHSLMAMKLAAELRSKLELPVSVGQIMVSPTVEGLAEVLVDETLRHDPEKAGFGHILPIRQGQGLPLICINPGSGFSWQYTGIPKYLNGDYPIIGLQSPRPNGAVAVSVDMNAAIEHYYALLKRVQPEGPYRFLGYSFGGTVAMALAAKLESQAEQVSFVGLLDTYPPEGQEWKRPTEAEAKEEVEREKRQFLAAVENDIADEVALTEQNKMFTDIVANYDDTVRLLSKASTQAYQGTVHLFVAEKTLPEGWNVKRSWAPFVQDLLQFRLPFSHDNILSPDSLTTIGPMLCKLLIDAKDKQ